MVVDWMALAVHIPTAHAHKPQYSARSTASLSSAVNIRMMTSISDTLFDHQRQTLVIALMTYVPEQGLGPK